MTTIADVARECAEDILQRGYREAFPGSEVSTIRCDLEGLIERRLTAFLRPDGAALDWLGLLDLALEGLGAEMKAQAAPLPWRRRVKGARGLLRLHTNAVPMPAPEPGRDAVGVSDG